MPQSGCCLIWSSYFCGAGVVHSLSLSLVTLDTEKGKVKMLIAHPKESRFLFLSLMLRMVYLWQWRCPKPNCFALKQSGYVTQGDPYLIRVPLPLPLPWKFWDHRCVLLFTYLKFLLRGWRIAPQLRAYCFCREPTWWLTNECWDPAGPWI